MKHLSILVLLGAISLNDAIKIQNDPHGFGTHLPVYWHEMVADEHYANTWKLSDNDRATNETAYMNDSPSDYYFPTGVVQWEPDALI